MLWALIGGGAAVAAALVVVLVLMFSGGSTPPGPGPGNPGNPPPGLQAANVPRKPFGDDQAATLTFRDGVIEFTDKITAADPVEPSQKHPCKIFLIALAAGRTYHVHAESPHGPGAIPLNVRIETREGQPVASKLDPDLIWDMPWVMHYRIREAATYRFIVTAMGDHAAFILKVRDTAVPFPLSETPELPPLNLPQPAVADQSLPVKMIEADKRLPLKSVELPETVHGLCLSKDGASCYLLEKEGLLRKLRVNDLQEEARLLIGKKCGALGMSAKGLLAAVSELDEIWLIDLAKLEVKNRLRLPGLRRLTASPEANHAFAACEHTPYKLPGVVVDPLLVVRLDVERWQATGVFRVAGSLASLTPDGKYLMTLSDLGDFSRWRPEGNALVKEEASGKTGEGVVGLGAGVAPRALCFRGDGKYVYRAQRSEVFLVEDLKKPAFTLGIELNEAGAVGFDPETGHVYVANTNGPLVVLDAKGQKIADYQPPLPRGGGGVWHPAVREIVVLPGGHKLLIRHDKGLYYTEIGKAGEPLLARAGEQGKEPGKEPPLVSKVPVRPTTTGTKTIDETLGDGDRPDKTASGKTLAHVRPFAFQLLSGHLYRFTVDSADFSPCARLLFPDGKVIVEDDDGAAPCKVDYLCKDAEVVELHVGSLTPDAPQKTDGQKDKGPFTLKVTCFDFKKSEPPKVAEKLAGIPKKWTPNKATMSSSNADMLAAGEAHQYPLLPTALHTYTVEVVGKGFRAEMLLIDEKNDKVIQRVAAAETGGRVTIMVPPDKTRKRYLLIRSLDDPGAYSITLRRAQSGARLFDDGVISDDLASFPLHEGLKVATMRHSLALVQPRPIVERPLAEGAVGEHLHFDVELPAALIARLDVEDGQLEIYLVR